MTTPDFIITGGHLPDGRVTLIASTKVEDAEIEVKTEFSDRYYDCRVRTVAHKEITIRAEVEDYVQVVGADYPGAWRTLFETWSPPTAEPDAIEARRAIER